MGHWSTSTDVYYSISQKTLKETIAGKKKEEKKEKLRRTLLVNNSYSVTNFVLNFMAKCGTFGQVVNLEV